MSKYERELRRGVKVLLRRGWKLEKNGHWKLRAPDGRIYVFSSSPHAGVDRLKDHIRQTIPEIQSYE